MCRVKKWLDEMTGLAWTLAGTGLVLITLTGSTRRLGIIISIVGLVVNLIAVALKGDEE
jgi:hypothetical protein